MTKRLQVSNKGVAGAEVQLDGEDIARDLTALTVHLAPGARPSAVLYVNIDGLAFDASDAEIELPPSTHKLLVQLGWTPPEGDGAS